MRRAKEAASAPMVLGVDTGFATLGWSALELGERDRIVAAGVFTTARSDRKLNVMAADDNYRRARELATKVFEVIIAVKPRAVVAEAQSWPRNSATCAQIGMCWGILASYIGVLFRVPLVQVSPQQVRRALLGKGQASKEEIEAAVQTRRPEARGLIEKLTPAGLRVHAWDSVAAIEAALDSEIVRAVRAGAMP